MTMSREGMLPAIFTRDVIGYLLMTLMMVGFLGFLGSLLISYDGSELASQYLTKKYEPNATYPLKYFSHKEWEKMAKRSLG